MEWYYRWSGVLGAILSQVEDWGRIQCGILLLAIVSWSAIVCGPDQQQDKKQRHDRPSTSL
jgi:hypothetical protein